MPALQQVADEFYELIKACDESDLLKGRCLQLGIGEIDVSHEVWSAMFRMGAVTIDRRVCISAGAHGGRFSGIDTAHGYSFAAARGPYSLIFVDAGHTFADVHVDHSTYWPLLEDGGIMAFHDAVKRPGYEDEIRVWEYLDTLRSNGHDVNMIGQEVGIGWIRKQS